MLKPAKLIYEIFNIYRLCAGGGLAERPRRGILVLVIGYFLDYTWINIQ